MKPKERWAPSAEQMALWPSISGNTINGVGEEGIRQPSPIYWHAPDATPHGPLQMWFMKRTTPAVQEARQAAFDPLVPDAIDDFGADDFCQRCQACTNGCPPQAIGADKVLVRGERRRYVDFDRCLPFFNEHQGCAICLAVCPWNYPGVAPNLVQKMATLRQRQHDSAPGSDR
jgi:Pyruvate/2-oxoacid:ferredoxin oxidoreductase delta subunit